MRAIEAARSKGGEIETAHERELVIYHHDLFVMAMKESLFGVDREPHAGMSGESSRQFFGFSATWPERRRQRRTSPKENPHIHPVSRLDEQGFECRIGVLAQDEVVLHVPGGDMHERTRRTDGLGDRLECLFTVDENLEGVPRPCGRVSVHPWPRTRFESTVPPDLGKSPPVMTPQRPLEAIPERAVHLVQRVAPSQAQLPPFVGGGPNI